METEEVLKTRERSEWAPHDHREGGEVLRIIGALLTPYIGEFWYQVRLSWTRNPFLNNMLRPDVEFVR